jgi:dynein light intermediate chain
MSVQFTESLVKYSGPQLVSASGSAKQKAAAVGKKGQKGPVAPAPGGTTRDDDYLNSILPPREYTENGALWVRYVSPAPSNRVDVIQLQDRLDEALQRR